MPVINSSSNCNKAEGKHRFLAVESVGIADYTVEEAPLVRREINSHQRFQEFVRYPGVAVLQLRISHLISFSFRPSPHPVVAYTVKSKSRRMTRLFHSYCQRRKLSYLGWWSPEYRGFPYRRRGARQSLN